MEDSKLNEIMAGIVYFINMIPYSVTIFLLISLFLGLKEETEGLQSEKEVIFLYFWHRRGYNL